MTEAYIYYTESVVFLTATLVIHLRKYFIYSISEKTIPEIINCSQSMLRKITRFFLLHNKICIISLT